MQNRTPLFVRLTGLLFLILFIRCGSDQGPGKTIYEAGVSTVKINAVDSVNLFWKINLIDSANFYFYNHDLDSHYTFYGDPRDLVDDSLNLHVGIFDELTQSLTRL